MIRNFNQNWEFSSDKGGTWTKVTLPHDAQMTLKRTPDAPGKSATGFFPGGDFLYRKSFEMSKEEADSHITFHFGGVYKDAKVRINGKEAGGCSYGYLPFSIAADEFVKEGENEIEVSCSNAKQPDSRWYSGAGIYRPVTMQIQGKERILPGSVRVRTLSIDSEKKEAVLDVEVKTEPADAAGKVKIRIVPEPVASMKDLKDRISKKLSSESDLKKEEDWKNREISLEKNKMERTGTGSLTVSDARLWSAEEPNLYRVMLSLPGEDGKEADHAEVTFGIRQIEKRADGIYINGQKILLQGGCIHSDNGVIGAREFPESAYRRVSLLKRYGFNAIRSAHNPISEELLDACDHLGMYIMDEMWDMWYRKKNAYDYSCEFSDHYREDIKATVDKDFNHPSVILYSIGNEVSEPAEKKGVDLGREMTALFHKLDPSRLVTGGFNLMILTQSAKGKGIYDENGGRKDDGSDKKMSGMNSTMFNLLTSVVGTGMNKAANGKKADQVTSPILDILDVAGYNYASGRYKKDGKLHPDRLIIGSETFPQDIAKNWDMVKTYPNLCGDFMWTAWDYLGEAGIGTWSAAQDAKGFEKPYPWLLGDTGALDMTGAANGEAFWAASCWMGKTYLAVRPVNEDPKKLVKSVWRGTNAIPSWSFAGCDGRPAVAEVYTGAPFAELYLNGKRIGKKKVKENRAVFKLKYMPGELKAVGTDRYGRPWKENPEFFEDTLKSAGEDLRIGLKAEEQTENVQMNRIFAGDKANGSGRVIYLDVSIEDGNGILESNCDRKLHLEVEHAELLGFGNANPRTEERFDTGMHTSFRGRALAVIRIPNDEKENPGITVKCTDITGDGTELQPRNIRIEI